MREEERSPRWWSVFEAALTGLACAGGRASIVDDATEIADYAMGEGTPKLAELRGVVQTVAKGPNEMGDPSSMTRMTARVAVGDDAITVPVPLNEKVQPGDRVVCSVIRIH